MSINNDPTVNANCGYFISKSVTGANPTTSEQIAKHNKETLFDFGNKVGTNLTQFETSKVHTVWTYGMTNEDGSYKTGFKWLGQFVDNLFHLSENLARDRLNTLREMSEQSTKLYSSLNFKFKLSDVKDLPMGTVDESVKKMETILKRVDTAKTLNADVKIFENLSRQITDIINQMKHLKLYAVENKILEQLKQGNFSTDTEIFQTLGTLNPKDPGGEEGFPSSGNYKEIKTKYDQLCTFKSIFNALNKLKNAKTPVEAYTTWSNTKEDLKAYGDNGEIAKLLEQRLDKAYTQKIKAISKDIQALEKCFIKGTEIPKGNLQNARRLCKTINKQHKAEALSAYIDDLEKGIDIRDELTKLGSNLSVLKDRSTSRSPEKFDIECKETETRLEDLHEQLKQISDDKITEALGRELLEATNELQNARNRVRIKADLETLQNEIDGLKINPTTEKAVFDNITTLSKNIEDKINNHPNEDEKTKLKELFGKRPGELKNSLDAVVLQNAQNKLDETLKKLKNDLETQKNSFIEKTGYLDRQGLNNKMRLEVLKGYTDAQAVAHNALKAKCRETVEETIRNLKQACPDLPREKADALGKKYLEATENTF